MHLNRRNLVCAAALLPIVSQIETLLGSSRPDVSKIPSTGETIPKVGLGTYRTFDVELSPSLEKQLGQVLKILFNAGGRCIDSSPMYGNSEAVVGRLTQKLNLNKKAFMATKVWTSGKSEGLKQINRSMSLLRRDTLDLLQVHNLLDWKTQLNTIRKLKQEKKVRFSGLTHFTTSAFPELIRILKKEPIDFIQVPYSIVSREAESYLFPLARDKGIAIIPNQSFEQGQLFSKVKGKKLPKSMADFKVQSWAQLFLKFVLSHPAVTTVIPGTGKPHHMLDNVGAGFPPFFDSQTKKRLAQLINRGH